MRAELEILGLDASRHVVDTYGPFLDALGVTRSRDLLGPRSGAELLVAPDARPSFYKAIERTPQIVGASSRDDTVKGWRQAMAEAFRTTMSFYVGFAGAIAFGVAYNMCRISLSERGRDLATLRVLGFGQAYPYMYCL